MGLHEWTMDSPPNIQATSPLLFSVNTPLFCRSGAPSPWPRSLDSGSWRSRSSTLSPFNPSCSMPTLISEFSPTSLPSTLACNQSALLSPTTKFLGSSPSSLSREVQPETCPSLSQNMFGKACYATPVKDQGHRFILTDEKMVPCPTNTFPTTSGEIDEDEGPQKEVRRLLDALTNVQDMTTSPNTNEGVPASPAHWFPLLTYARPHRATEEKAVDVPRLRDLSALPLVFPSSFSATPPSDPFCSPLSDSSFMSMSATKPSTDALLRPPLPSHKSSTVLQTDQHWSWSGIWNPLPDIIHLDSLDPESPPLKRQRTGEHQRKASSRKTTKDCSPAVTEGHPREDHLDGRPLSSDTDIWPSGQYRDFLSDKGYRLGSGMKQEEDANMGEHRSARIDEGTWPLPAPKWTDADFNETCQRNLNIQRQECRHLSQNKVCPKKDPVPGSDSLTIVIKWKGSIKSPVRSGNIGSNARPFMTFYSSSERHRHSDGSHGVGSSVSSGRVLRKRKAPLPTFKMQLRSGRNAPIPGKSEPALSAGFQVAAGTSSIDETASLHNQELPLPQSKYHRTQADGSLLASSTTATLSGLIKAQSVDAKTLSRRPIRKPRYLPALDSNKSSDDSLAGLNSKVLREIDLQHLYPRLFDIRVACDTSPRCHGKQGTTSSGRAARSIFNPPRSDNDLYTPRWTKGTGREKVGLCPICMPQQEFWQKMKCSAYWYHLHFHHGVSAQSGAVFPAPKRIEFQDLGFLKSTRNNIHWNEPGPLSITGQDSSIPRVAFTTGNDTRKLTRQTVEDMISEPDSPDCLKVFETALTQLNMVPAGLCENCSKWIPLDSVVRESGGIQEMPWWKHMQQCQKVPPMGLRTKAKR